MRLTRGACAARRPPFSRWGQASGPPDLVVCWPVRGLPRGIHQVKQNATRSGPCDHDVSGNYAGWTTPQCSQSRSPCYRVLLGDKRATSASFFGVSRGKGFILSFDISLGHWIFGLQHLTNTEQKKWTSSLSPRLSSSDSFLVVCDHGDERRQARKVELRSKGAGD